MINAVAGLCFGLLGAGWLERLLMPVAWGFVACAYHHVFSERNRHLFLEESRRRGQRRRTARLTYYWLTYRRAFLISVTFSFLAGALRSLAG